MATGSERSADYAGPNPIIGVLVAGAIVMALLCGVYCFTGR
jgi:hypothetical protein